MSIPLDPALLAGGSPPLMDPMTGQPMPVDVMAGGAVPPPGAAEPPPPAGGMVAPPPVPPMVPPPPPPDPIDQFIQVLMDGEPDEILDLLSVLGAPEKAMLREVIRDEIAKTDPLRADYLMTFLPEKRTSGQLPSWMKHTPPRPSAERVNELALADADEWGEVVKNDQDTLEYLIPPYKSHAFKHFDPKKDSRYYSPMLINEIKLLVSKGAASDYRFEMPFVDPAHTEATQQCEDFLYECDRQAARLWAGSGYGDMEMDAWYTLATKGRLVQFIQPCIESEDHFLTERLMDPSNTYPTWAGERGLERVTRMYDAAAAEVIGDYDPDGSLGVEAKIIGKILKGGRERVYENDTRGQVVQYWDRWWYVVLFDGIEVISTPHEYGFVPFVFTAGNTGLPKFLNEINVNGDPVTTRLRDTLKKAKYGSYIDHMKEFAGIREAIGTVFLSVMAKMDDPAQVIYQDQVAEAQGTPSISRDRGAVNPLKKDREELADLPENKLPPAVFEPFYRMFGQDASSTFLPEAAHGVGAGANQSGNALENLFEVGNDKFVGLYKAMAQHKAAVASMRLALWRDWGHSWKDSRGKFGRMMVPYPASRRADMAKTAPPAYEFLPETVEMVGTTVEVDYTSVRLQNLTQLGNAVMIWQQAKAMSAREAMEIRGVRNPDAVLDQIMVETLMTDPDMIKLKALSALKKVDPELAAKYEEMVMGAGGGGANAAGTPPKAGPNSSAMNLTGMGMGAQGPTGRPGTGGPGVAPPGGMNNG